MKESVNILIACTGSVAALKLPLLLNTIIREVSPLYDVSVKYCVTEKSQHFFSKEEVATFEGYSDADEWNAWNGRGDPVLHVDLTKWADVLVIAPLDANSLGKIAGGICDNLVLCIARAWEPAKPLLFCPAMNSKMWTHPITARQISVLEDDFGYIQISPVTKRLMCGDTGPGAMAEVSQIVSTLLQHIPRSLQVKNKALAEALPKAV